MAFEQTFATSVEIPTMSFVMHGIGTALPRQAVDQTQATAIARAVSCETTEQASMLSGLYRQSGVNTRYMVLDQDFVTDLLNGTRESACEFLPSGEPGDRGPTTRQRMMRYAAEALPLAEQAARRALDESGMKPSDLTHIVTVSCTGFTAPGLDIGLINALELNAQIQRTHVGFMGCHGAINGLRVGRAFAEADETARVLICAVELSSLHYYYGWDPKKMVANALFADGAAAVVGEDVAHPARGQWQMAAAGSCLFPRSQYAMTWDIGDHGFEMSLSSRVPGLIATNLRPWLEGWLAKHNLAPGDIGTWAVHPGGPRILSAVEESLGLSRDALVVSREILAECGNMSSPTILFILQKLLKRQAPRPCVAIGFGPGLIAEAALFT
jgi:predicted naringenin-chalcone synthase